MYIYLETVNTEICLPDAGGGRWAGDHAPQVPGRPVLAGVLRITPHPSPITLKSSRGQQPLFSDSPESSRQALFSWQDVWHAQALDSSSVSS